MFTKVNSIPATQIPLVWIATKKEELHRTRYTLTRENITYYATFDTFGDAMPNDMTEQDMITIWLEEDTQNGEHK